MPLKQALWTRQGCPAERPQLCVACGVRLRVQTAAGATTTTPEAVCALRRRVQNLFHSVSLNVNNPHFLIMQGRITKVRLLLARLLSARIAHKPGCECCGYPRLSRYAAKEWVRAAAAESRQHRIDAQVPDMKPAEILGILEEAAGTP